MKTSAENHYKDLAEARSRSQAIRRLALNPMILTALAVIHWNQKRRDRAAKIRVKIRWFEVMAYAAWKGCTLPTETQWERAARGPDEKYRIYPWGNKKPDKHAANWHKAGLGHPSPVGIFPPDQTKEGVYDMAGNVREWCLDWRDVIGDMIESPFYVKSDGSTDPLNDETGEWGIVGNTERCVVRGGSWNYGIMRVLRCCYRNDVEPTIRDDLLGFRLVRSAP